MNAQIKEIINALALDIRDNLSESIKNMYYDKMSYSGINIVAKLDNEILCKNISFEIAFIHIITYIFCVNNHDIIADYHNFLEKIDVNNLFGWYNIKTNFIEKYLSDVDFNKYTNIYTLINLHDTLIDKDIKKKFGQFYTPIYITKKMVREIKSNIKELKPTQKISDPACGTGVFLVEILNELKNKFSLSEKMKYINENIYAYDVNPFAIVATKLNLIYTLISNHKRSKNVIFKVIINSDEFFKNIQWKNTITQDDNNKYSIIIGNPPYFKLNNLLTKDLDYYQEISYGQTNIYSLFTFWAITHLEKYGVLCFIIPQSIRSGLYFKDLRTKINNFKIRSMIQVGSRTNIFDRAEQWVLILCLENKNVANTKTKIQFYDWNNNKVLTEFKVSRSKLMMDESFNNIFIVNQKLEMYDILEKVYRNNERLDSEKRDLKFCNGLFVWNQHKKDSVDTYNNSIPIVYGGNVQPLKFSFGKCSSNQERKLYSKLNENTSKYVLKGKRLLVQRTTNFEKNIRIKSCIMSDEFLNTYNKYFLENHINYLSFKGDKNKILNEETLYYYLGILNSKLLNYIFVSMSGNTQVSASELNSLPFPTKNDSEFSKFVKEYLKNTNMHQNELDLRVCRIYGLSDNEINFIMRY